MTRPTEKLDTALGELFANMMCEVHTAMPGRVVSFNNILNTCSVQPVLQRKYVDDDEADNLPIIEDVPIVFPGSGDFWVTFDVKEDSYVLLVFSERSIADWMTKGGIVDPRRTRKHHLSDAIAIPGILPNPEVLTSPVEADAISMRNKADTVNVKVKTAEVQINNGTGTAVEFARLKTAFDLLKADFNIFVGTYNSHTHTDPVAGVTGPPVPTGSGSTADMSGSESPTVKVP
jgi:hypothetical protein